jgi:hypothetical protein
VIEEEELIEGLMVLKYDTNLFEMPRQNTLESQACKRGPIRDVGYQWGKESKQRGRRRT